MSASRARTVDTRLRTGAPGPTLTAADMREWRTYELLNRRSNAAYDLDAEADFAANLRTTAKRRLAVSAP